MPIYEYKCKDCEEHFEKFLLKRNDKASCPSCESTDLERIISQTSLKRGDGFTSPEGYMTKSRQRLGLNE